MHYLCKCYDISFKGEIILLVFFFLTFRSVVAHLCIGWSLVLLCLTEAGRLMARYCIAFETMKKFCKITGKESISDLVGMKTEVSMYMQGMIFFCFLADFCYFKFGFYHYDSFLIVYLLLNLPISALFVDLIKSSLYMDVLFSDDNFKTLTTLNLC